MRYLERDVLMYHYVKEMPPYFGIVVKCNDKQKTAEVVWWSVRDKKWDEIVAPSHDYNCRYTTLIGRLPDWVEGDEKFGFYLP